MNGRGQIFEQLPTSLMVEIKIQTTTCQRTWDEIENVVKLITEIFARAMLQTSMPADITTVLSFAL